MSGDLMATSIPCTIIRGGTSKGIFLREEQLPRDTSERDALLLALMGSPDPRQIDGLGGADPLTSKVAIVGASRRWGIDVEYESVEVAVGESHVNHGIMCGNLAAAVGAFAILEGLVSVQSPITTVRILCRSNNKIVVARLPMPASSLAQMPWDGALGIAQDVSLSFEDPGGAVTGRLLPLGEPVTNIVLDNGQAHRVSIVDAGTLYAFAEAASLGVSPETPLEHLDGDRAFRARVEFLREQVASKVNERIGNSISPIKARRVKVALVAPPAANGAEADIAARIVNPAKIHKAYAVSGGICLAAAAAVSGTAVHDIIGPKSSPMSVRIAHPSGVMSLGIRYEKRQDGILLLSAAIDRKARVIMRGNAFVQLPDRSPKADYAPEKSAMAPRHADEMLEA